MIICFDLDGPILDVSERYYRIHSDLFEEHHLTPLPKHVYWDEKRQRTPEGSLYQSSGGHASRVGEYEEARRQRIEDPRYLILDKVWLEARAALDHLRGHARVFLVTLRQNRGALLGQLEHLALVSSFDEIPSCGGGTGAGENVKVLAVRGVVGTNPVEGWFVGDTEADLDAGRDLGLKRAAVGFGIRTPDRLQSRQPEAFLARPTDLLSWARGLIS